MRNDAATREVDARFRIAEVIGGSRLAVALFAAIGLGAGAQVNPDRAFQDVSDEVSARTGQSPRWARTADATKAADDASRLLLRDGLTVDEAVGVAPGFLIIHPRKAPRRIDRDFCILPHMWFIEPGSMTPDSNIMLDFNIFTFNSRAFPGTEPLVVKRGDRVKLRLANISMTAHPIHIHGHRFWVVETDGGQIPESAWWPETTLNIMPGTTRGVEFVADAPRDWPLHCHKSHHAMNAMGHDIPNVIGVDQREVGKKIAEVVPPGYMTMGTDGMAEHAEHAKFHPGLPNTLPMMTGEGPFGNIELGGMFTVFNVREGIRRTIKPISDTVVEEAP